MVPYIIIFVLLICLGYFAAKWALLRRSVQNMTQAMEDIHLSGRPAMLTVDTQDKTVVAMAVAVNRLYKDSEHFRIEHVRLLHELQQNMADISHDFRTPLTSILGYLSLLQKEGNTKEQTAHYLEVAYRKGTCLNEMVNALFEQARLESGSYPFQWETVEVREVLSQEIAAIYEPLVALKIEPAIELGERPLKILADPAALRRIFSNLLQNMVKHGRPSQGGLFSIRAMAEKDMALFIFSNPAPELIKEDLTHLFKRSFVADTMRSSQNTGLGLSIVKEFVEQMNGTIHAELAQGVLCITVGWKLM